MNVFIECLMISIKDQSLKVKESKKYKGTRNQGTKNVGEIISKVNMKKAD